jgi:chromosomal replication initiation ATPase DnaA
MKSKILTAFLLAIEEQHPMDEMIDDFCKKGGFERSQLFIKSRRTEFVRLKRLFANYMCDTHTKIEIARYLNKNHSTVLHYLNTHSENLEYDKIYNKMWVKLLS